MSRKETKRQTRLTFSPLLSSSPASSRSAIASDRAAAFVRFKQPFTGVKQWIKRSVNKEDSREPLELASHLPTPAASSQPEVKPGSGLYSLCLEKSRTKDC